MQAFQWGDQVDVHGLGRCTVLAGSAYLTGRYLVETDSACLVIAYVEEMRLVKRLAVLEGKPMAKLQVGDVVRLRSGGPQMTVIELLGDDNWTCHWFDRHGVLGTGFFPMGTLVLVADDPPSQAREGQTQGGGETVVKPACECPGHEVRNLTATTWDQIQEIRCLQDDWDGFGAKAPSDELVDSALELAKIIRQLGYPAPSTVVADPTGAILFNWQIGSVYLDAEITEPHHLECEQRVPKQPSRHWVLEPFTSESVAWVLDGSLINKVKPACECPDRERGEHQPWCKAQLAEGTQRSG